jgi:rod shape-determining protein MreB
MAGDRLDDMIAAYIRRRHNLVLGDRTAEEVKLAVGSALPVEEDLACSVRGRDLITGLPKTITVTSNEITGAIQDGLAMIVQAVRSVFERTPPELASDVIDHGIVLTGGGALLRHLDELITQETGVPCVVADQPMQCVAIGAGIALEYLDLIKRNLPTEEELL